MSTTKAAAAPSTGERASASPATPAAAVPIGLAQQLGNQGLQRLLQARLMQAKLTVNHPQDVFEHEADQVADQVMRMPAPSHSPRVTALQPRMPQGESELHRSSGSAPDVPTVDAATENSIPTTPN